jgi:putative endonuclease
VSTYHVYIVTNAMKTLYTGMSNNLERRIFEHRARASPGFSSEHGTDRLVFVEAYSDINEAIAREKQIKGWRRPKKIALIEANNPGWDDLSEGWE